MTNKEKPLIFVSSIQTKKSETMKEIFGTRQQDSIQEAAYRQGLIDAFAAQGLTNHIPSGKNGGTIFYSDQHRDESERRDCSIAKVEGTVLVSGIFID